MQQANVVVSDFDHKIITISVMLATVMQALDMTIANVALPHMQGALSATQDQTTWILTFYIISSAITIPFAGWLATQIGRKKVFLFSIVGFTIASVLCGLAESLTQIVIFRVFQGICGAALAPLSQAVLLDINSRENFGKAMATWGMGITVGPILGPALGGWLTNNYNWRWVFYINIPIGILAFIGLFTSMPEIKDESKSRFDFIGFITLSLSVGSLQLMLDRGQARDWFNSIEIVIEALVIIISFYWFIIHTLTHRKPFINPKLFTDRNFMAASIFMFIIGIVMFASLALVPAMLQSLFHYPIITIGIVTAPRGIGTMCAMLIAGKIANKFDARKIMAAGLSFTALSLWQMSCFAANMDYIPVITSGFIQGFGLGLVYVPISMVAFATLPQHLRNEGTALFSLLRNIGSAVGISIVTFLLIQNTQIMHSTISEHITAYSIHSAAGIANKINSNSLISFAALNARITGQASMISYLNDFKLLLWLTLVSIPPLALLRRAPKDKT
jgi:DHA2 family multidrug resistance protein